MLTEQYFEEQLQCVLEICLPARRFYQNITDIYATLMDYDVTAQATKRFFANVKKQIAQVSFYGLALAHCLILIVLFPLNLLG